MKRGRKEKIVLTSILLVFTNPLFGHRETEITTTRERKEEKRPSDRRDDLTEEVKWFPAVFLHQRNTALTHSATQNHPSDDLCHKVIPLSNPLVQI